MNMSGLVAKTRTVRRFQENRALDMQFMRELIDLARLSGSARNAQALQYMPVLDKDLRSRIFPHLAWAGYLANWPGPGAGERPAGYIVCLANSEWQKGPDTELYCDLGIASQSMLLAAGARGVSGCRIGAFKAVLHELLRLRAQQLILLVLALGYPAEEVVLEEVGTEGDIRYWHDEMGVHHVPKRALQEVLLPPPELSSQPSG